MPSARLGMVRFASSVGVDSSRFFLFHFHFHFEVSNNVDTRREELRRRREGKINPKKEVSETSVYVLTGLMVMIPTDVV